MKILSEFKNKLVGRTQINGSLRVGEENTTIKREDLRTKLAKKYKVEEDLVVIVKILPHFGDSAVTFSANIYESKELKEKYEAKHLKKRNEIKKQDENSQEEEGDKKQEEGGEN